MKAAVTNYVIFALVCVTVLFVSMAVADQVAQATPMEGKLEAELATISCERGSCGPSTSCCPAPASEEANAAAAELSHGLGARRGGYGAAGEAKEKDRPPIPRGLRPPLLSRDGS